MGSGGGEDQDEFGANVREHTNASLNSIPVTLQLQHLQPRRLNRTTRLNLEPELQTKPRYLNRK
jgi:hypothetical protein